MEVPVVVATAICRFRQTQITSCKFISAAQKLLAIEDSGFLIEKGVFNM
jgi:hypothetical protein